MEDDQTVLQDYVIYSFVGSMTPSMAPAWLLSLRDKVEEIAQAASTASKRAAASQDPTKRVVSGILSKRARTIPQGGAKSSARDTRLSTKVRNASHLDV